MSETFESTVDYAIKFHETNARTLVATLIDAITRNWRILGSLENPPIPSKEILEQWFELTSPNKMERVPDELIDEEKTELYSQPLEFPFSPISTWTFDLTMRKNRDGTLGLSLSLFSLVMFYESDDLSHLDTKENWPANKKMFNNIIEKLMSVMPLDSVYIPPNLIVQAK